MSTQLNITGNQAHFLTATLHHNLLLITMDTIQEWPLKRPKFHSNQVFMGWIRAEDECMVKIFKEKNDNIQRISKVLMERPKPVKC